MTKIYTKQIIKMTFSCIKVVKQIELLGLDLDLMYNFTAYLSLTFLKLYFSFPYVTKK